MTVTVDARRAWMRSLALGPLDAIEAGVASLGELPAWTFVHRPEIGLVMVRGRAGGTGDPFNLGEATVTRARVRVGDIEGFACVGGRAPRHAELAAACDALLQHDAWSARVRSAVIDAADAARDERRRTRESERAATKADFVTVVRSGET